MPLYSPLRTIIRGQITKTLCAGAPAPMTRYRPALESTFMPQQQAPTPSAQLKLLHHASAPTAHDSDHAAQEQDTVAHNTYTERRIARRLKATNDSVIAMDYKISRKLLIVLAEVRNQNRVTERERILEKETKALSLKIQFFMIFGVASYFFYTQDKQKKERGREKEKREIEEAGGREMWGGK